MSRTVIRAKNEWMTVHFFKAVCQSFHPSTYSYISRFLSQ